MVNVGAVNVLFVMVSVPANVASVPVVGKVTLVAAVVVNVVAKAPAWVKLPAVDKVVPFANVNVPVVVVIFIPLMVLLVNASLPANVASVPVVGNVTLVAAVEFIVVAKAPAWVKLPAVDKVVPFANVNVPVVVVIFIPLIVLLVNASLPANVAIVPVVGNVTLVAPVKFNILIDAPPLVWSVLPLAKVNVALLFVIDKLLIEVAVAAPRVGVVNVGAVNVLFVSVSVPPKVAKVPLVGKVTLVAAVETIVVLNAPEWTKLPAVDKVVPFANVNVPDVVVIFNPFKTLVPPPMIAFAGIVLAPIFKEPPTFKLPFNETSPLANSLPFNDKSSLTINW